MSIYHFNATTRTGDAIPLSNYRGSVLLIVNTASKCALTYQFEGLQALHLKYARYGLQVLAFPCNQFANQDPADSDTIAAYCQKNYGVTFPVFRKTCVNGDKAHPLFTYLKSKARGKFWSKSIKWNFTKFLVDHNGQVLARYSPVEKPHALEHDIERALIKKGAEKNISMQGKAEAA